MKELNNENSIPNSSFVSKEERNVPNLRFTSEIWTKTNLESVCDNLNYGIGAESIEFDGVNRYIRITDIDEATSQYIGLKPVSPAFIDDTAIVKENDILFARTGASTGKTYLYNNMDGKLYYAGYLIRGHIKDNFDSYFIFQQTKIPRYNNWILKMSARSGQPGISAKEYKRFEIFFPTINIQIKIANFIKLIDNRIVTQNKIIEEYESLIKAIRCMIFSKSSQNNPETTETNLGCFLHEYSKNNIC